MRERSALMATQDHALICMVFILGQAENTVDAVDLFTRGETLERQFLETRPDISDRRQNSRLGRRNAPWNIVRPQHGGSHKWIEWLHWLGVG
jgi:hypothetical protein